MTDRYQETVWIYDGIRYIERAYSHRIPEDFINNLTKAEAASFVMKDPVTVHPSDQTVKDSIAFLNLEI
jgi:hypothetical protein